MVFAVGMYAAEVMESGLLVCPGILFSDMPVVHNYQSDCLSTLFAWILISPNSVLTPSGECVGDGERKCACVCCDAQQCTCQRACLMYFSQTWVRVCGMQNMQILPVISWLWLCWWGSVCTLGRRVRLVVCSHRRDTRVEVLVLSNECSGYWLIPRHWGYQANTEFAGFTFRITRPCKNVQILLTKICLVKMFVQCIIILLFIQHGAGRITWHCVHPHAFVCVCHIIYMNEWAKTLEAHLMNHELSNKRVEVESSTF